MRFLAPTIWILSVIGGNLLAQKHVVPLDESDKQGMLEIRFVDSLGIPIPPSAIPIVTVEDARTGRRVLEKRAGLQKITLQYGTYILRTQLSPAYPVDKKITIRNPFQVAFICFTLAPIELPWDGNIIHGRVSMTTPAQECRWIRLVSAFSEADFAEAKATDSGRFILENVRPGTYLGIVSGMDGICSVTRVNIIDKHIQEIELNGSSR